MTAKQGERKMKSERRFSPQGMSMKREGDQVDEREDWDDQGERHLFVSQAG